jgi:phage shock protein E
MSFLSKLFGPKTDYKALVENGAIIVDVRTTSEYKAGHINGSVNIPVDTIKHKTEELKKKGKPVIACCASGMRSGMAAGILKQAGIEAYNGGSWNGLQAKL